MKIRKNRYLLVFLASMLLFSNVAWAARLCLMDDAQPARAPQTSHAVQVEDPCCYTQNSGAGVPDNCCAVLGLEHGDEAVPAMVAFLPPLIPVLTSVIVRDPDWGTQRPALATPTQRNAGPPLNLLFKNFRV